MLKRSIILSTICLIAILSFGNPNWKRVNHISSTIFTAIITVDGKPAPSTAFVGAFKDGECRMIAPIRINNDTAYVSSVIHGDVPETMSFKIWLSEGNEKESEKTLLTKPSESILLETIDF